MDRSEDNCEPIPAKAGRPVKHTLPRSALGALLSGHGDSADTSLLCATEQSWRWLHLWALQWTLGSTTRPLGPLPSWDEAWRLLARAQGRAAERVRETVTYPHVGIWAAYTLRRLRDTVRSEYPMWIDVGYFHALSAAAAIRAGIDFHTRVPMRDGSVVLPGLGHVVFPEAPPWDHAEVINERGVARVVYAGIPVAISPAGTDRSGPTWCEPHELTAEFEGQALRVVLDDYDTYRSLREPTPPNPLSESALRRWQSTLDEAWKLLVHHHPERASALAEGLRVLAPLPEGEPFRPPSASAEDAFGSALASMPESSTQLASTLIHEFQHNKLGAVLHLFDLQTSDSSTLFYAPWRDDPRPLGGMLQGVYAFVAVAQFWAVHREIAVAAEADLAQFEFALWRRQTAHALEQLDRCKDLTDVGIELVESLTAEVEKLQSLAVPDRSQVLAALAAHDHESLWRMYHLVPDRHLVTDLVKAWQAGEACPGYADAGAELVRDDPAGRWIDARAVLVRLTLVGRLAEAASIQGARPADVVLVSGDAVRAREMYLTQLVASPDDPWAWSGLMWTLAAYPTGHDESVLRERPELVRAVQRELVSIGCPADPLELVAWMSKATDRAAC
ncbi:MAG TPA: HEXXH motif domain-containing protein [Rugosimonospora sp.]|nr:HEXXH motif domain-containing protein [Rugosimonospora sp.]